MLKIAEEGDFVGEGILNGYHLDPRHSIQLVESLVQILNVLLDFSQ